MPQTENLVKLADNMRRTMTALHPQEQPVVLPQVSFGRAALALPLTRRVAPVSCYDLKCESVAEHSGLSPSGAAGGTTTGFVRVLTPSVL